MLDKVISALSESFMSGSFQLAQGSKFCAPLYLPSANSANADPLNRPTATQVQDGSDLFLRARTNRGTWAYAALLTEAVFPGAVLASEGDAARQVAGGPE